MCVCFRQTPAQQYMLWTKNDFFIAWSKHKYFGKRAWSSMLTQQRLHILSLMAEKSAWWETTFLQVTGQHLTRKQCSVVSGYNYINWCMKTTLGSLRQRWKQKWIVDPKVKICWKCTHPQAIQDVDEFVSSSKQKQEKFSITSLTSSAVNGCHQNESLNSWWKHHNNPQVIHVTPVHQLMSCEVKSCMFVINKYIIKAF